MALNSGHNVIPGTTLLMVTLLVCPAASNGQGALMSGPGGNTLWHAQAATRMQFNHLRHGATASPQTRVHSKPVSAMVESLQPTHDQAYINEVPLQGNLQDGPTVSNMHTNIWDVAKLLYVPLATLIMGILVTIRQRQALTILAMSSMSGVLPKGRQPSGRKRHLTVVLQAVHRLSLIVVGVVAGMSMVGPAAATVTASSATTNALAAVLARVALWSVLFGVSSAFHAAEVAITTLWPWKVKEFAEDEGKGSPFHYLAEDITRVLTTILVASTICTVYGTAIITTVIAEVCVTPKGIAIATAGLTAFSLFFQELTPKALGVANAELVARTMVPMIAALSYVLNPIGIVFGGASKALLQILGLKTEDSGIVTDKELRLLLEGARVSGTVEMEEAQMIQGVLNLDDTKVCEVMTPRVDMVAIERSKTLRDLLELIHVSKFSRIPVYKESLDKIVGVVLARSIFNHALTPSDSDSTALTLHSSPANQAFRDLSTILVKEEMEPTYFVPETMTVSNVLEQMRKRRLHLALVVDEYGGTSGVVTLEDLLEEIVGEIYDEDDVLSHRQNGGGLIKILPRDPMKDEVRYAIRGEAELKNVEEVLRLKLVSGNDDFVTLSGLLCARAGYIPQPGDLITVPPYVFNIKDADQRRIISVIAVAPMSALPPPLHQATSDAINKTHNEVGNEFQGSSPPVKTEIKEV